METLKSASCIREGYSVAVLMLHLSCVLLWNCLVNNVFALFFFFSLQLRFGKEAGLEQGSRAKHHPTSRSSPCFLLFGLLVCLKWGDSGYHLSTVNLWSNCFTLVISPAPTARSPLPAVWQLGGVYRHMAIMLYIIAGLPRMLSSKLHGAQLGLILNCAARWSCYLKETMQILF